MPKFTVQFSALTDMVADVEVEADTPELAVELARIKLDPHDFELCGDGAFPIKDSEEPFEVRDADGEIVLTPTQASYSDIAAVTKGEAHVFDARELAAILTSLRLLQHIDPIPDGIDDVFTDGGALAPLDPHEIDALCERLNRTKSETQES